MASTGFAVCTPRDGVSSRFLYYAMMTEPFLDATIRRSVGISYPAINAEVLGSIKVPLPGSNIQRAIVVFLDREAARIDALIAEKGRFVELLREKWTAVISRAVTRGLDPDAPLKPSGQDWLGDVPAHWRMLPVNICL
ncbi:MAG: restriction endonuclease subunit S [Shimia sp.]